MSNLQAEEYKNFDKIKNIREDGTEYWSARELSEVLQYVQWRNFAKVIDRAKLACKNSGKNIDDDFAEVSKIVEAGATQKKIIDYELSRYACYLIVQNGDPRKSNCTRTNIFCNSNAKISKCRIYGFIWRINSR